jgi:hypothetical protein
VHSECLEQIVSAFQALANESRGLAPADAFVRARECRGLGLADSARPPAFTSFQRFYQVNHTFPFCGLFTRSDRRIIGNWDLESPFPFS